MILCKARDFLILISQLGLFQFNWVL